MMFRPPSQTPGAMVLRSSLQGLSGPVRAIRRIPSVRGAFTARKRHAANTIRPVYYAAGLEVAHQWTVEECRDAKREGLGLFENEGRAFRLFSTKPRFIEPTRNVGKWPSKEIPGVKFVGPKTVPMGYDADGKYVLPLEEITQCSGSV